MHMESVVVVEFSFINIPLINKKQGAECGPIFDLLWIGQKPFWAAEI